MSDVVATVDVVVSAVTRLRNALHKGANRQVRNAEERALVKATAQTWFKNHRPALIGVQADRTFKEVDRQFAELLEWSDQSTTRLKYRELLRTLKADLVKLRSGGVLSAPSGDPQPPEFALLIRDPKMLAILERRWTETLACKRVAADLAATVMLGGLLEALFLARINSLKSQTPVHVARTAPRDKAGKTRPLKEWGLKDYLDVANELGWIRQSAKDVGQVLRDYRNYIHPEKEFSHGVTVNGEDTTMFVMVFSSIAEQIIASAKKGP
jgi:hypothetical protein